MMLYDHFFRSDCSGIRSEKCNSELEVEVENESGSSKWEEVSWEGGGGRSSEVKVGEEVNMEWGCEDDSLEDDHNGNSVDLKDNDVDDWYFNVVNNVSDSSVDGDLDDVGLYDDDLVDESTNDDSIENNNRVRVYSFICFQGITIKKIIISDDRDLDDHKR
jgi:hypothetical protein